MVSVFLQDFFELHVLWTGKMLTTKNTNTYRSCILNQQRGNLHLEICILYDVPHSSTQTNFLRHHVTSNYTGRPLSHKHHTHIEGTRYYP